MTMMNLFTIILIYIVIMIAIINSRITIFKSDWIDSKLFLDETKREVVPADIWIALSWPIYLCFYTIRIGLWIIHNVISYMLLMFFIKYIKTDTYHKINSWIMI
jgi:hypothetical protein